MFSLDACHDSALVNYTQLIATVILQITGRPSSLMGKVGCRRQKEGSAGVSAVMSPFHHDGD